MCTVYYDFYYVVKHISKAIGNLVHHNMSHDILITKLILITVNLTRLALWKHYVYYDCKAFDPQAQIFISANDDEDPGL